MGVRYENASGPAYEICTIENDRPFGSLKDGCAFKHVGLRSLKAEPSVPLSASATSQLHSGLHFGITMAPAALIWLAVSLLFGLMMAHAALICIAVHHISLKGIALGMHRYQL